MYNVTLKCSQFLNDRKKTMKLIINEIFIFFKHMIIGFFTIQKLITRIHFHRVKRWVINCRRSDFDRMDYTEFWKTRVICSMHFQKSMYNNPNDIFGSRLMATAVPSVNIPNLKESKLRPPQRKRPQPIYIPSYTDPVPKKKVKENHPPPAPLSSAFEVHDKIPSCSRSETVAAKEPEKTEEREMEKGTSRNNDNIQKRRRIHLKCRNKYLKQRRKIWSLNGTVRRLREVVRKLKNEKETQLEEKQERVEVIVCETDVPKQVFNFIKSQKRFYQSKLGGMRWTEDDMKLATSIHFQSPAAYRFLQNIFGLPCLTLIHSRLRNCFPESGICMQLLAGLKEKFACTSELQRYCVLSFDGMKIEQGLNLMKNDQISGFEEVGDGFRRNSLATELLVFMVRGLSAKWKQVNIEIELTFTVLVNIKFSFYLHSSLLIVNMPTGILCFPFLFIIFVSAIIAHAAIKLT